MFLAWRSCAELEDPLENAGRQRHQAGPDDRDPQWVAPDPRHVVGNPLESTGQAQRAAKDRSIGGKLALGLAVTCLQLLRRQRQLTELLVRTEEEAAASAKSWRGCSNCGSRPCGPITRRSPAARSRLPEKVAPAGQLIVKCKLQNCHCKLTSDLGRLVQLGFPLEFRMSNKECRNLKEDLLEDRCLFLLAFGCLDTFDKMPLLQISTFLARYSIFGFRIQGSRINVPLRRNDANIDGFVSMFRP